MKKYIIYILAMFALAGCEDLLEEQVYSSLSTNSYFNSEEDYTLFLYGTYKGMLPSWGYFHKYYHVMNTSPSELLVVDEAWAQGEYGVCREFTIEPSTSHLDWAIYRPINQAIARANVLIDKVNESDILSAEAKSRIASEAKFIRALCYFDLSAWFGGIPLITTSAIDPLDKPARATVEAVEAQIEKDLLEAMENLPVTIPYSEWTRATKGSAQALLCKLYMRQKQWQKASDAASQVIGGPYELQPAYGDVFSLSNEGNREIIYGISNVFPNSNDGNLFNVHSLPSDYTGTMASWSGFRATHELYNYFEPGDHRRDYLIYDYPTKAGDTAHSEFPIVIKYPLDPAQNTPYGDNDEIVLRLADIILCKAEAVNELSGPTQEAIDLVNQVRERAFQNTDNNLTAADLPTMEAFRDYLVVERARELYHEGKRREDLIRFGKYLEFAENRGVLNFDEHNLLYPIPLNAINSNPNLVQNPGY